MIKFIRYNWQPLLWFIVLYIVLPGCSIAFNWSMGTDAILGAFTGLITAIFIVSGTIKESP